MDAIYCLPCYLFSKKPIGRFGSDAFILTGFNDWKKVNTPSKCPKLQFEEIDRDPGSRKQISEFPINKQDEIR